MNFFHITKYVGSEKDPDPKRLKSRIRIRYYLKVGSGSVIDWTVGSGSEINSFGSATPDLITVFSARRREHVPGRQGKTWPYEKSRHATGDSDIEIIEVLRHPAAIK